MSVFRNVRIYPNHGNRSAVITWELASGVTAGDVFVAFSENGIAGSWLALNPTAPVPSEVGMYQHDDFVLNKGSADGFYRLLLTTDAAVDHFSEPFQIIGDLTPREYGIIRSMIHQEYTQMRVTAGYPVWHCIPREHGELAANIDPDTEKQEGAQCSVTDPAENSFGMKYKGGFWPPILTWMRVLKHSEALQDDPEQFSTTEMNSTAARLMAFPRPARRHMIVNPATDTRYLIGDEIKPYRLRGVIAVAYDVTLEFLNQSDERYQFPVPALDTKAYRRIPYWAPVTP